MTIIIIVSLILVGLIAIYTYFILGSLIYLAINVTLALLVAIYIIVRMHNYLMALNRKRFMFSFIELFILNFDVQKSANATLNVIYPLFQINEQKKLNVLQKEDGYSLLENLKVYFNHHYYDSFFDIYGVVSERGGQMMKVSEVLLYSISNSEAQILKLTRIDTTFLIKFLFNWLFIMIVALIFRFALVGIIDFTNLSLIYIAGHELFLLVFTLSIILVIENRVRRSNNVS